MRLPVLVSSLAVCALAQTTGGGNKGPSEGQLDCPPSKKGAHIIACSGHGGFPHDYGLLQSTLDGILNAIPGSNNYSVPYPKKNPNRPIGVGQGVVLLTENIKQYTKKCPKAPIILLGYSEGAIVTSNTLCGRSHMGSPWSPGIANKYNKNIIATILYGDETFISGQPYNQGTCKDGHGVNPRQNPDGCKPFEADMHSWCDAPDPECCGGKKNYTHYRYPKKYDPAAISFAKGQYKAWLKNMDQSTSPTKGGGESGGGSSGGSTGGSGGGSGGNGGSGSGDGGNGGNKPKPGKGGKGGKKHKPGKGGNKGGGLLGGILHGIGLDGDGGGQ